MRHIHLRNIRGRAMSLVTSWVFSCLLSFWSGFSNVTIQFNARTYVHKAPRAVIHKNIAGNNCMLVIRLVFNF